MGKLELCAADMADISSLNRPLVLDSISFFSLSLFLQGSQQNTSDNAYLMRILEQ